MWLFSRVNSLDILETITEFLVLGKAMYIKLAEETHLDGYIEKSQTNIVGAYL